MIGICLREMFSLWSLRFEGRVVKLGGNQLEVGLGREARGSKWTLLQDWYRKTIPRMIYSALRFFRDYPEAAFLNGALCTISPVALQIPEASLSSAAVTFEKVAPLPKLDYSFDSSSQALPGPSLEELSPPKPSSSSLSSTPDQLSSSSSSVDVSSSPSISEERSSPGSSVAHSSSPPPSPAAESSRVPSNLVSSSRSASPQISDRSPKASSSSASSSNSDPASPSSDEYDLPAIPLETLDPTEIELQPSLQVFEENPSDPAVVSEPIIPVAPFPWYLQRLIDGKTSAPQHLIDLVDPPETSNDQAQPEKRKYDEYEATVLNVQERGIEIALTFKKDGEIPSQSTKAKLRDQARQIRRDLDRILSRRRSSATRNTAGLPGPSSRSVSSGSRPRDAGPSRSSTRRSSEWSEDKYHGAHLSSLRRVRTLVKRRLPDVVVHRFQTTSPLLLEALALVLSLNYLVSCSYEGRLSRPSPLVMMNHARHVQLSGSPRWFFPLF